MQNTIKTVFVSATIILSSSFIITPAMANSGCAFEAEEQGFMATCSQEKQEVIITGLVTPAAIEKSFPEQYNKEFTDYSSDSNVIEQLKKIDTPTEIVVIIGTWCPDCHRETPRFIKIMEQVNNPNINVKFIGVDRKKADAEGLAAQYEFTRIPTFIVQQDNKTIGTIIERPTVTLEQDLYNILNK
ncbi:thioredoxin family protein [Shewanella intestini]|uniref:Thioredoxin n=1 Tax=Shewanella intestini TaxID=2017544 RepID=A0ABS5I295_9GAMM|nr:MULTISPECIES: thioredoxin family protein [Shewanella]MBR9727525.1 thioredoxin [Shewanella intestini]MRG35325.1 thioredoxin [Shewanella sp. XMDDZSB0408]